MKQSPIRRYMALTAILPILMLAGCKAATDATNKALDDARSNTQGERQLKARSIHKELNDTPRTGDPNDRQTQRAIAASAAASNTEAKPDSVFQQSLITWQNEIAQAAANTSDNDVQISYNILITALDTQTDAQIADLLYHISIDPLEFEVILYKITPAQQTALWNRLPASRVNNILNYVQPQHQTSVAVYLGDLNQIGLVAPTSVPWNRIPSYYLAP